MTMPKQTGEALTQGMQGALDEQKKKELGPDALKLVGVQKTGMAMGAAEAIAKRKKAMEEAMK